MPAALDVDWGAVRTLAVVVGAREAARRMGISEDAVRQRCTRERWMADLPRSQPLPLSVSQPVAIVATAAQAMVNGMQADNAFNRATVLALAKKKLAHLIQKDPDTLLTPEMVSAAHQTAKDAALAGAWQNQAPTAKVYLAVTGAHEVSHEQPVVQEADWTDAEMAGSDGT